MARFPASLTVPVKAAAPTSGQGRIYFDTTLSQLMFYDGSNWCALARVDLDGGTAAGDYEFDGGTSSGGGSIGDFDGGTA